MKTSADALTSASLATAWVIVANKPFYPIYIWWLVGSGVRASLWTLLALPLYLAIATLGRRAPFAARAGLALIGLADTALSTILFGQSSGVEAFLAPCAALAALSFAAAEVWASRALTALVFLVFAGFRLAAPVGLFPWPAAETAALVNLNLYSAAALTAFVGLRFASARK